ncbi:dihydrolipoyllysine-residue acetyltransferase [Rhabdochromatium marinum]|uniref:dihydrolipoyllysine-residue acetyltransferase n=1 Tax=Rhabdochromatium marinum TaxID=48729 RepID=UPI00190706F6|nr:dihydrolipoyllysine-residue acetyltransferase [Rhabdochromatium marinum]MBK1647247.1 dihydrolipoyllysine-residue acetyltransferase [Rhabdochromatium marinum]
MAKLEEVLLPDIGDFKDVEIIEILVAPGERIAPEQSLLTLESDKASIEIPSPMGGEVKELLVSVGDRISQGHPLMRVATAAAATPAAETSAPTSAVASVPASTAAETGAPPAAPAAEEVEICLPDVGDFADIPVIEVLVGVGDQIAVEQSILTLESDKATMEIPAPRGGTVTAVEVQVGDTVSQGDRLFRVRTNDTDASQKPGDDEESAPAPAATPKADAATSTPAASSDAPATRPAATAPSSPPSRASGGRAPGEAERRKAPILPRPADMAAIAHGRTPHASPAVRRFARELGVDLHRVKGSGRKQRILKEDVQRFVKHSLAGDAPAAAAGTPFQLPSAPAVDFSKFGPVASEPLPRIKKISGAHLHRCWLTVPHVTQFDEADITELEAFRKEQKAAAETAGVKLTFMPFLLKAVATALNQMPIIKASLAADGEQLIHKHYCHIGVAVDTPNGLVVPVVRDVDQKGLFVLAEELMSLSQKARDGKLLAADMQGGVFSISSLGGIGGTAFTPIVNAPEVAILGVSRTEMKPVWDGQAFQPRLMLPLSLSYDHRVVDGADGVRFTSLLRRLLSDIRRLLL